MTSRLALLLLAVLLAACDTGPGEPQSTGAFTATLTGSTEASLVGGAGALPTAGGDGVSIQLLPREEDQISISFVGPFDEVGTYAIDAADLEGAQATFRESRSVLFGVAGEVRVREVTGRRIEGTFTVDYAARPRPDEPTQLSAEGTFSAVRF